MDKRWDTPAYREHKNRRKQDRADGVPDLPPCPQEIVADLIRAEVERQGIKRFARNTGVSQDHIACILRRGAACGVVGFKTLDKLIVKGLGDPGLYYRDERLAAIYATASGVCATNLARASTAVSEMTFAHISGDGRTTPSYQEDPALARPRASEQRRRTASFLWQVAQGVPFDRAASNSGLDERRALKLVSDPTFPKILELVRAMPSPPLEAA